jgi:hypothetical protein
VKKFTIIPLITISLVLVGCGRSTYQTTGAQPDESLDNGQVIIVESSGDSNATVHYTEVGDGSIIIYCGDGDNYECNVYIGVEVEDPITVEVNS